MKIHSKREVQHIPDNHSGDIHYKDFLNIYRKYAIESCSFLLLILHCQPVILCFVEKIILIHYKNDIN